MEYKDYYQILGVEKKADEKEIKRTYRKLAREFHPDVNPNNPQAEEKLKEINQAYETLGDPEKRRQYDTLGSRWQQWQGSGQGAGFDDFARQWASGVGGSTQHADLNDVFRGDGSLSDLLDALFGGLGGRSRRRPAYRTGGVRRRGQDLEQVVEITLEEAARGARRLVERNGRRLDVKIPAGVANNSRIRIAGKGSPGFQGMPAGNLYLKVQIKPHPVFERREDDLHIQMDVDLYTAILGGQVRVPILDGHVNMTIPQETQSGRTFRLQGKGMPRLNKPEQHGDLYVQIRVRLPQNLSEQEISLFSELASLRNRQ